MYAFRSGKKKIIKKNVYIYIHPFFGGVAIKTKTRSRTVTAGLGGHIFSDGFAVRARRNIYPQPYFVRIFIGQSTFNGRPRPDFEHKRRPAAGHRRADDG